MLLAPIILERLYMAQNEIFNTICALIGNKMKQPLFEAKAKINSNSISNHTIFSSESCFPVFMPICSVSRKSDLPQVSFPGPGIIPIMKGLILFYDMK